MVLDALKLLRLIARIQCVWWLPYKAIVKRLREACSINDDLYKKLYQVDEPSEDGQYYRIGLSTNEQYFRLLNSITRKIGTSAVNLENVLRNFEDDIISEDELVKGLELFNKTPADFEIQFDSALPEDEWKQFQTGEDCL